MRVTCENCGTAFKLPLQSAGKVEYSRCKNVFRVTYRFRTSCPSCRKVLQLVPKGTDEAIGTLLSFDRDEKTEMLFLDDGATLPRTAVGEIDRIPATVRVTRPKPVEFQILDKTVRKSTPAHVSLKPGRKSIPVLKFLLSSILIASTAMTIALTLLALKSNATPMPSPTPIPAIPKVSAWVPPPSIALEAPQEPEEVSEAGISPLYLPQLSKLSSEYGIRKDPFLKKPKFHGGIDIASRHRAEVMAALEGRVQFAGEKGGYGRVIVVENENGYETVYAHLSKMFVKKGNKIKQGDLIGLVGSTGHATGPHLHFELRKDGKRVDPLRAELMARKS